LLGIFNGRAARLAFFRPNFRKLASFQLVGLKIFSCPFGIFWRFGFLELKQILMKENIAIPFFSATHLQNFCDKCYIRRPHSDISNI